MLPHLKNSRSDASYQRKTVPLAQLVEYANRELARTHAAATKEYKMGICNMIDHALHWCRKYKGFAFIDIDDSRVHTLGYYSRRYYV